MQSCGAGEARCWVSAGGAGLVVWCGGGKGEGWRTAGDC